MYFLINIFFDLSSRYMSLHSYIVTDKLMGNQIPQISQKVSDNPYIRSLPIEKYIVKTLLVHSQEHHRQLVNLVTKFKQLHCPHLLQLVDSHSVQSHSLCSVVSQLYLFIQKPTHTLVSYHQHLQQTSSGFNAQQLISLLLGCSRAVSYLLKEGIEVTSIREDCIFVEEKQQGKIAVKVLAPLFGDDSWDENKAIESQIASIASSYLNHTIPQQIRQIIRQMGEGELGLKELEERLGENRKNKAGLKLTRDISHQLNNKKETGHTTKPSRQSFVSMVSNTSSLMIDSGDFSDLMFRQFYQNFDDSISEIPLNSPNSTSHDILSDETNHAFPKKYLRGKAFRRSHKSEWPQFESSRGWSDWKSEGQNLTRDQSGKENIGFSVKPSMFQSARLAESSMGAPLL